MREKTVGDLIYRRRVERNITQKQLCDGLCSVQTLSKIESGERIPDVFLLEYLLQRLGVSADDWEIVLFGDELQEIELQDIIEEKIYAEAYSEAERLVEEYYSAYMAGIKAQYYNQIRASIASQQGNHSESISCIEAALRCTGVELETLNEKAKRYSTKELELMCMMAQEYIFEGKDKSAKILLDELLEYVERNSIEDKELVKTYPKIVFCMAGIREDQRVWIQNVNRCEKAFELLIHCDSLVFLPEIMELLIEYYQEMKLPNKANRLKKQLQSLLELASVYGNSLYMTKNAVGWFAESGRKGYLLCEEMIRGERKKQNLSRGMLVEGIYEDVETLARIENGTQSPSHKKYMQMMERLNRPSKKYIGPPLWDDDLILIAKEKIGQSLIEHEYEDAKEEIEKLKLLMEENDCLNKQYIKKEEAYLEFKMNHINAVEFIKRIEEVLKITYSEHIEDITRIPTLDECYIFNYLLLGYRKNGMEEDAIELYEKLLKSYKLSKIREKYNYRALTILHRNYITLLEEMNCTERAKYWAKEGIRFELQAHRGKGLDYICTEFMCIFMKMDIEEAEKKKQVEKYLRLAFYLSDLFVREKNNRIIDDYYKSHIDSNVQWYI